MQEEKATTTNEDKKTVNKRVLTNLYEGIDISEKTINWIIIVVTGLLIVMLYLGIKNGG